MRKSASTLRNLAPRILIVDENRNGLLARKSVLEDEGYQVEAYSVTAEALEAIEANNFDLVITDFQVPSQDGNEVIERVRRSRPNVPIIVISAMVDAFGLDKKNTKADAVISKSATELNHLLRTTNRLLKTPARKPAAKQLFRQARKTSGS